MKKKNKKLLKVEYFQEVVDKRRRGICICIYCMLYENKIAGKASNDNNNGWKIIIIILIEPVPKTIALPRTFVALT